MTPKQSKCRQQQAQARGRYNNEEAATHNPNVIVNVTMVDWNNKEERSAYDRQVYLDKKADKEKAAAEKAAEEAAKAAIVAERKKRKNSNRRLKYWQEKAMKETMQVSIVLPICTSSIQFIPRLIAAIFSLFSSCKPRQ